VQFIGPAEVVQRRQFVRLAIDLPITVCWLAGQVGVWERAVSRTQDISTGGLRVACAKAAWPSTGSAVLVAFDLPSGPVQAQAEAIGKTPCPLGSNSSTGGDPVGTSS
jgi:c-di-GMP-binding flagellar brake protein YcgR